MAIKAKPIISEEIYLQDLSEEVKELEGDCPRDEQAWVMIRQATEADNLRHEREISTVELTHEGGVTKETRYSSISNDRAFEIYLTLHDAGNITGADGQPLFEFKDTGPYNRVKGTFDKFKDDYGLLPGDVTRAMCKAVYLINPKWDWLGIAHKEREERENPTKDTSKSSK